MCYEIDYNFLVYNFFFSFLSGSKSASFFHLISILLSVCWQSRSRSLAEGGGGKYFSNFTSGRMWSGLLNWMSPTQMWFVGLDRYGH